MDIKLGTYISKFYNGVLLIPLYGKKYLNKMLHNARLVEYLVPKIKRSGSAIYEEENYIVSVNRYKVSTAKRYCYLKDGDLFIYQGTVYIKTKNCAFKITNGEEVPHHFFPLEDSVKTLLI